jgi:hydrogenase 3 maturation protease
MTAPPNETDVLATLKKRLRGAVVVAGVGNVLRGDDAAGPRLIEMLQERLPAHTHSTSPIHLVNCGTTPENYIGEICRLRPDTILVVDSAAAGLGPGAMRTVEIEEVSKRGFSTHELSPALFMRRLKEESGADVFLAAVQPATRSLGESLSDPVTRSLAKLCDAIEEGIRLNQHRPACRAAAPSTILRPHNLAP